MKIVGIAGMPRSGKDALADMLIAAGYYGFSFGDYTRDYARKRHADKPDPISVTNMTETSNWLRETYGPDVILQAALKEFNEKQAAGTDYKGMVLYSVRAPVEVNWILAHDGDLIWMEADDEVRHERHLKHMREGELPIDLAEFKRQEALQSKPQPGLPAEVQMDLSYVKAHATGVFENNGHDLEEFHDRAQALIHSLS